MTQNVALTGHVSGPLFVIDIHIADSQVKFTLGREARVVPLVASVNVVGTLVAVNVFEFNVTLFAVIDWRQRLRPAGDVMVR